MSLFAFIQGGGLRQAATTRTVPIEPGKSKNRALATATTATTATTAPKVSSFVANVANVAVANPQKSNSVGMDELEASMRRLEAAGIFIAVCEDGSMRVVVTEAETLKAIDDGGTVYSPQDMYHYVTLSPSERLMLHSFKKRFRGTTEWRKS